MGDMLAKNDVLCEDLLLHPPPHTHLPILRDVVLTQSSDCQIAEDLLCYFSTPTAPHTSKRHIQPPTLCSPRTARLQRTCCATLWTRTSASASLPASTPATTWCACTGGAPMPV